MIKFNDIQLAQSAMNELAQRVGGDKAGSSKRDREWRRRVVAELEARNERVVQRLQLVRCRSHTSQLRQGGTKVCIVSKHTGVSSVASESAADQTGLREQERVRSTMQDNCCRAYHAE
jgi:hypothetical protein